jgi:hypothetical protein
MVVLVIEVPSECLVQFNELAVQLDSHLLEDVVDHLCFLEVLLGSLCFDGLNLLLGEIDISFLLVDSDDHHGLLLADLHELLD